MERSDDVKYLQLEVTVDIIDNWNGANIYFQHTPEVYLLCHFLVKWLECSQQI